jgi:hypothetical protein
MNMSLGNHNGGIQEIGAAQTEAQAARSPRHVGELLCSEGREEPGVQDVGRDCREQGGLGAGHRLLRKE